MIHVLVFDGFADWEPAYALAELRRSGNYEIVSAGFTGDEVTSMGPEPGTAGLTSPKGCRSTRSFSKCP